MFLSAKRTWIAGAACGGLQLLSCGAAALAAQPRPPIGTNLNGLSYWSAELPFLDAFKSSGEWISGTKEEWKDGRALDLDPRGWVRSLKPGQVANMILFHDTARLFGPKPRRWIVEHEGAGVFAFGELAKLIEQTPGRDVIEIEPGEGNATVTLVSTAANDPLRNIRVLPYGIPSKTGEIFSPAFLAQLRGYRALRFMIWMLGESPEDTAARRWRLRPLPQDARWTIKGAPVEIMVALSNRLRADPWFSLPHAADDEYVRKFAELVKKQLDPSLRVYLEYSNEVWNEVFPQTAYARERGFALRLATDPGEATLRYYAGRSVEIFKIWEKVFPKERLVRVLAFQSDISPEYADEIALSFGDTLKHVDAMAVAPYFGAEFVWDDEAVARTRKMTLDDLMRELESAALPKAKEQMLAHATVARKYGLPLIAYEGGQHLWDMGGRDAPELTELFYAANRDPRMGRIYTRYLNDWAEIGGGLFVHLLDCGSFKGAGNWGALEYLTQPRAEAPKYDALMRFAEGR